MGLLLSMKDKFNIVIRLKKFCISIDDIVVNFPKREFVVKDKILRDSLSVLEEVYYLNALKDFDVDVESRCRLISKLNMIDFYIEYLYSRNIINEKVMRKFTNELGEITKMVYGWLRNGNKV